MEELTRRLRNKFGDPEGDFSKCYISVDGHLERKYVLNFHYRKKKPDGTFTKKTFEKAVVMVYNPFTGEKLD